MLRIIGLGVAWLLVATHAFGASPRDFFCMEVPLVAPVYYQTVVRACGDGKTETIEGVCAQTVQCAYVTDEAKKAVRKSLGKDFSALSKAEKIAYIKEEGEVDLFPTTLLCRDRRPADKRGNGAACPPPDRCKEDIYYGLQAVDISHEEFYAEYEKIKNRVKTGSSKMFEAGSEPAAGAGR